MALNFGKQLKKRNRPKIKNTNKKNITEKVDDCNRKEREREREVCMRLRGEKVENKRTAKQVKEGK